MSSHFSFVVPGFIATVYPLTARAQDVVFAVPIVPGSAGPLLAWVLTVAGSMLSIFIPLVAIWFRNYLNVQNVRAEVQNTQSRSQMINGSIERAAQLADADMTAQNLTPPEIGANSPIMQKALTYVANSHPGALAATPQATDEHITDAITAELNRIQTNKANSATPTVVLSPVSAVR
jgi:hypothetical protein